MNEGDEVNLEKGNDFSSTINMYYKNLKQNSKNKLKCSYLLDDALLVSRII